MKLILITISFLFLSPLWYYSLENKKKDFITIGVAYNGQEIKSIPYEEHDERLDFLITEKQFYQK